MKKPSTSLGLYLRELRNREKLTQVELAQELGLTASFISQIETGGKNKNKKPSPEVIHKLSARLHVKPNDLFKLIGMVEMDFDEIMTVKRVEANHLIPELTAGQIEELAKYLAFMEFRSSLNVTKKVLLKTT